jgi:hypothetical protein
MATKLPGSAAAATRSAGVGISLIEGSAEAGREAARAAMDALGSPTVDAAAVFCTSRHDIGALLTAVQDELPGATIFGGTGEGIIGGDRSEERDFAVGVMALRSNKLRFQSILTEHFSQDPVRCGRDLTDAVKVEGTDDLIALLLIPDGLTGNCAELLRTIRASLPPDTIIAGGTAADAMSFDKTTQFGGGRHASDAVAALAIRGRGRATVAVSHGCSPIGLPRTVTKANGSWIQEIDGKPAWEEFKEYLDGDPTNLEAEGIMHLCIGLPMKEAPSEIYPDHVITTPLRLDEETGALFCPTTSFEVGQTIRLNRRDIVEIRENARGCAKSLHDPAARPSAVFQFDCAGRGRMLYGAATADALVRPLQAELGIDLPWIGFHTYGEIGAVGEQLLTHNYTVVLVVLYEDD